MKKRQSLSRKPDRRSFKKHAVKTHKKNNRPTHIMRGGYRL